MAIIQSSFFPGIVRWCSVCILCFMISLNFWMTFNIPLFCNYFKLFTHRMWIIQYKNIIINFFATFLKFILGFLNHLRGPFIYIYHQWKTYKHKYACGDFFVIIEHSFQWTDASIQKANKKLNEERNSTT